MADDGARLALMTAPDPATAESIVRRLVEERVVACGNILPGVTSIYRWRDEVEGESEVVVLFKTTAAGAERLVRRVPELHPYEVPEVIVLPIVAGLAGYLDWINESVDRA